MALGADKYTVLLEGKETVSRATIAARKELDKLGGPGMVKATQELNKVQRQIKLIGKVAKKSAPLFSKFTKGIALGNIASNVATAAFRGLKNMILGVIQAGIAHEKAWNDVTAGLRRHGMEIDNNLLKIQRFSDEMQTMSGESDETIGKMVQGFLDYGQTVDEAMKTTRVAMDLAAGSGMELKAAMELLAKAAVGYTGTLSRYGIIIDQNIPKAEKFAEAIKQITERFGGAAVARADTFAVKVSLLTERFGDLQEQLFYTFSPALLWAVNSAVEIIAEFTGMVSGAKKETENLAAGLELSQTKALELTTQIEWLTASYVAGGIALEDFRTALSNVGTKQEEATIGGLGLAEFIRSSFIPAQEALNKRLEDGSISLSQYNNFLADLKAQIPRSEMAGFAGVLQDVIDKQDALAAQAVEASRKIAEALIETAEVSGYLQEVFDKDFKKMADVIFGFVQEIKVSYILRKWLHKVMTAGILEQEEELNVSTLGAFEVVTRGVEDKYKKIEGVAKTASRAMEGAMWNASRRMIGSLKFLQTQSTGVFKNMASDFATYFLEEVTRQLMIYVAKWIVMLIFFDNPRNDRMAIQSGRDFIDYFNQGISEGMPSIQAGRSGALATPAPLLSAGGGGGATTINLTFSGPVTSEAFVRDVVAPVIEQVVRDGGSDITLSSELLTGDRDVIL